MNNMSVFTALRICVIIHVDGGASISIFESLHPGHGNSKPFICRTESSELSMAKKRIKHTA